MLTETDYRDYDTCVALKELGYNGTAGECSHFGAFYMNGKEIFYDRLYNSELKENECLRVPLYLAQKWLREEKDIHVEVYACAGGYIYELCKAYKPNSFSGGTTIYTPNDVDNPKLNDAGRYDDFETCLSEGIKEAVKILKDE